MSHIFLNNKKPRTANLVEMEGFINLGETCYVNAALQALLSSERFLEACKSGRTFENDGDIASSLAVIASRDDPSGTVSALRFLRDTLGEKKGTPGDAVEFATKIMEGCTRERIVESSENCECVATGVSTSRNMFTGVAVRTSFLRCGCSPPVHAPEEFVTLRVYGRGFDVCESMNSSNGKKEEVRDVECSECGAKTTAAIRNEIHCYPSVMVFEGTNFSPFSDDIRGDLRVTHRHGVHETSYEYALRSLVLYDGAHYTCAFFDGGTMTKLADDDRVVSADDWGRGFYPRFAVYERVKKSGTRQES